MLYNNTIITKGDDNMAKDLKCEEMIIKSRVQLLISFPFYGTLALALVLEETDKIPTAAVDGKKFYYNPQFINSLTLAEINWVVAHEVMHCALGHIWRRGNRQHEKFNIAADYAIHSILKESESDKFKMPAKCLYDKKFNDKATEEIYDMLPDMPKGGYGMSTMDDHSLWDNAETQENASQKARDWQEKMVSAAEVAEAKKQGSVPGGISRLVGKIKKPQKNWRQLLAEFIQFEVFDYGFVPPDRRYYGFSDILMPDYNENTEKIQDIVFIIDTSGSVSDKEMIIFFSELVGMMHQFNNSVKGHILFIDAEIAAEYDFEDISDILKAKPEGGGGTDMEIGIKYAMQKKENDEWDVCGCCILTDGFTSYTMDKVDIPFKVLWLITNETETPTYGQVARLKI